MSEVHTIGDRAPDALPTPQPAIFSTKIPASVAFGIGVLLFFMPFVDIKCNSMTLQKVTGVQLATGFEVKGPGSDNSLVGDFDKMDDDKMEVNTGVEKNDPNTFALVALGLGVMAFVLTLVDSKGSISGAVITGALASAALIGAMIDIKRKVRLDIPEITNKARDSGGLGRFSDKDVFISIDFTAWFYIAILAFIAATWLCYRRLQTIK
jgi:hypothetical protein